jgi:hypothetical protein
VTDPESTPITGTGELITNDGDDGTYATLNNAALVISGDRVAWAGPASRAPAADRADRTDLTNTPIGDGVTRWAVRANARSG